MIISRILKACDHPYLTQPGGRRENNGAKMQGMTAKSLKHHKALQPLFIIIGAGMVFVAAYIGRLASKTTDVNWSKQKDPSAPMEYYADRQFKMLNPLGTVYEGRSQVRPKYE